MSITNASSKKVFHLKSLENVFVVWKNSPNPETRKLYVTITLQQKIVRVRFCQENLVNMKHAPNVCEDIYYLQVVQLNV